MNTTHELNPCYRLDRTAWRRQMTHHKKGTRLVGFVVNRTEELDADLHAVTFEAAIEKVEVDDVPLVLLLEERSLYRRVGDTWLYAGAEHTRREVVEGAGNDMRAAICECMNSF